MTVIVVDVANVVGSRPDGWWRDRAAATARVHAATLEATRRGAIDEPVVLVVEGAGRRGVSAGRDGLVEVVHADRSGDDAVVELLVGCRGHVVVVTADRELIERTRRAGAEQRGPAWFRRLIELS